MGSWVVQTRTFSFGELYVEFLGKTRKKKPLVFVYEHTIVRLCALRTVRRTCLYVTVV